MLDEKTKKRIDYIRSWSLPLFPARKSQARQLFFWLGDSAGLATLDLGEGIGPAVESGLMAANNILGKGPYEKSKISRFSLTAPCHLLQKIWQYSDESPYSIASQTTGK